MIRTNENMLEIIVLLFMVVLCCAGCGPCQNDLVTGPYGVSDSALSASSTHDTCALVRARFNDSGAWCPAYLGDGHYLQVEFQSVSVVKAVKTKGRGNLDQWVSSYSVNISMDGITWTSICNATGNTKVFTGNSDRDTVVTNLLEGTVITKYIRVISVNGNDYRSLRLEVQGCSDAEFVSPCCHWEAQLGSPGVVHGVIENTYASHQGLCGLKCTRHLECDSFQFDVVNTRCRLLKTTLSGAQDTVNLEGVWYFKKV